MNSTHCSRLLLAAVVLAAVVGGAAAVTVQSDVPAETEVNESVTATLSLQELYEDPDENGWTLEASTDIRDAQWNIQHLNSAGEPITEETPTGEQIETGPINADDGVDEIRIVIQGRAPEIESYRYREEGEYVSEQFTVAEFVQVTSGAVENELGTVETHHYTDESRNARSALDDARDAVESAQGSPLGAGGARTTLNQAISSYENGNFDNAIDLANEARNQANLRQYLFYGIVLVLVLLLVGGGYKLYLSRRDDYDKLG